jgi:hypothetical protein
VTQKSKKRLKDFTKTKKALDEGVALIIRIIFTYVAIRVIMHI